MSWAIGFDSNWDRDIGYGVPATCDHPGCGKKIDRGLAHVCCGSQPYGGEEGCGLYFCGSHLFHQDGNVAKCQQCNAGDVPFPATPDHPEWAHHKLTDPSWEEWRRDHTDELPALRELAKTGRSFLPTPESGEVGRMTYATGKGACTMGVGCDEAGSCFAAAMGAPEECCRA